MRTYRPEVVDKHVENAQQNNQYDSTPLCLEPNNDHDGGDKSQETDKDSPERPGAREDKADKEEDQQNSSCELDVHLAILLFKLRETGGHKLLANP